MLLQWQQPTNSIGEGVLLTKWDFSFRKPSATLPQSFRKEIMNKKCDVAYAFLFAHDMFDKYVQCKMPEKGKVRQELHPWQTDTDIVLIRSYLFVSFRQIRTNHKTNSKIITNLWHKSFVLLRQSDQK